ncbi:MAG: hypothetical protein ABI675_18045 [Chitinophagaceae bacterium]
MNIQNIGSLANMLVATGFEKSIGQRLLQRICFKPADFVLTERLVKGNDVLTCSVFFERKSEEYSCNYYDAAFLKAMELPDLSFHGIHIRELDKRMGDIDWALINKAGMVLNLNDESTWQREKQIEKIVSDLLRLSVVEEGRYYADSLKVKYWTAIVAVNENLNTIRSKFEVSQRFYFFDGQGISIEEAYRFLLNRWLEKKLHSRKKNTGADNATEEAGTGDKSLLQKKRKRRTQKITK